MTRFLSALAFILSLPLAHAAIAETVIFDDALQNGAAFWKEGSGSATLSGSGEPVHSGSHSTDLYMAAWTQSGIAPGLTVSSSEPLLEFYAYRPAGSSGTFVLRYGSSWTALLLKTDNNAYWWVDGQPGNYAFSSDAWHLVQVDLEGLGLVGQPLRAVGVKGSSTPCHWYVDDMLVTGDFESELVLFDDAMQNGANFWKEGSGSSTLSGSGDPVASGSHSIKASMNAWTQSGISIGRVVGAEQSTLRFQAYRPGGMNGAFKLRDGSWLTIGLSTANNAYWTVDGAPGDYAFSSDAWHTVEVDLLGLGLDGQQIKALAVKAGSTPSTWYLDDVTMSGEGVAEPQPPIAGNWTLTFQDEFSGSKLDPTLWRIGQHWLGIAGQGGNDPENIVVSNGTLKLIGEKRPTNFGKPRDYATGEISTFRKFRQLHGYYEARIKADPVVGTWPAFWTMPDNGSLGNYHADRRAFLKFDLSGYSSSVSSATLRLKVLSIQSTNNNLSVHPTVTTDWTEGAITFNNMPAFESAWLAQINGFAAGDEILIDVKDYVNQQIAAGKPASFAVVDTFLKDSLTTFGSKESSVSADRPSLIINGATTFPTDDAYVQGGSGSNSNFGSATTMLMEDPWTSTSSTYDGGMEIDIYEALGVWGADAVSHVVHWDGYGEDHQAAGSGHFTATPTGDGFHTYGMYWEPGQLTFYVDGIQTWQWTNSRVCSIASYIILSHQMGGWPGSGNEIIDDLNLPAVMEVDYVRVWSGTAD